MTISYSPLLRFKLHNCRTHLVDDDGAQRIIPSDFGNPLAPSSTVEVFKVCKVSFGNLFQWKICTKEENPGSEMAKTLANEQVTASNLFVLVLLYLVSNKWNVDTA